MIDKRAIGRRIVEARQAKGITSQDGLKTALQEAARREHGADTLSSLTRQTVQNWEAGKVVPPWDKVALLAAVFGEPYGEEWIMFGSRRDQELAAERPLLVHLTQAEADLIQDFRHCNEAGRKSTRSHAKTMREEFPAETADIHQIRTTPNKKK